MWVLPLYLSHLLSFIWHIFCKTLWEIRQSQHDKHTYVWRVRGRCVAPTCKDLGTKWEHECDHTIAILYFKQSRTMGEVYLYISWSDKLRHEGRWLYIEYLGEEIMWLSLVHFVDVLYTCLWWCIKVNENVIYVDIRHS